MPTSRDHMTPVTGITMKWMITCIVMNTSTQITQSLLICRDLASHYDASTILQPLTMLTHEVVSLLIIPARGAELDLNFGHMRDDDPQHLAPPATASAQPHASLALELALDLPSQIEPARDRILAMATPIQRVAIRTVQRRARDVSRMHDRVARVEVPRHGCFGWGVATCDRRCESKQVRCLHLRRGFSESIRFDSDAVARVLQVTEMGG